MTNREYIEAQIGFSPASTNTVEAALIDAGVTGSDTYSNAVMFTLKTAAISVLYSLLSTPDTTQGQGETANSIKYDRTAILKRIGVLEAETSGIIMPTIKAVSRW